MHCFRNTLTFVLTVGILAISIAEEPLILLSPNGGESYAIGDTIHVEWRANPAIVPQIIMDINHIRSLILILM